MARVYGIQGNVTGKIANAVYAVVKGVNVVRAYNASPANPQTPKQVESRAKLKELSQLSAAFAPIIGYQAKGLVSARNLFTQGNYEKVSYTNDVANVDITTLDLTGSRVGLGVLDYNRSADGLSARIVGPADGLIAVVYGVTVVKPNGAIIVKPVKVITTPGVDNTWSSGVISLATGDAGVIWAWGIRANDASQFAKYGYLMTAADNVASLMVLIKQQYAGSQTVTETLNRTFAAYQE